MPNFLVEDQYKGKIIAGVDEAGRGPLAGPVVAAAVIINRNKYIENIDESKKITKKQRNTLYDLIVSNYDYGVAVISADTIDKINILQATKEACLLSVKSLKQTPDIVLVDGNMQFSDTRFHSIVKGDQISYSIAAASIIAKVTRDQIMDSLAAQYPLYQWHKNSGYGTKYHIDAIQKYGPTNHHRKTFAPVKYM